METYSKRCIITMKNVYVVDVMVLVGMKKVLFCKKNIHTQNETESQIFILSFTT